MEPIRSIAEIPFVERDPLDLLNLAEYRDEVDSDYYEYGYTRVDSVSLVQRGDAEPLPIVRDALILALHSADEGEFMAEDIELEFFAEEVEDDYSVTVLLSDFLSKWLPVVSGGERSIVLALCNPHRATVARPEHYGDTPIYYAIGDVESFLDYTDGRRIIALVADEWRIAE